MKRRNGIQWSTVVLAAAFAASVAAGVLGGKDYPEPGQAWTDVAYRVLTMFTINASFDRKPVPLLLDIARFLSPATLAGAVVALALSAFRERLRALGLRLFARGHVVFVGAADGSATIAEDLAAARRVVFLVPADREAPVDAIADSGAELVRAPSLEAGWRRVGAARAAYVFVMEDNDAAALAAARGLERFLAAEGRDPKPAVFTAYSDDFALRVARELAEADRNSGRTGGAGPSGFVERPFNLEQQLARAVVDRCLPALAPSPGALSAGAIRVAIFGFGDLGQALAVELAQLAHFPGTARLELAVVDRRAPELVAAFLERHPALPEIAGLSVLDAAAWRDALAERPPALALVARDDAALAFDDARALRQLSEARRAAKPGHPGTAIVLVRPLDGRDAFPDRADCAAFLAERRVEYVDPADELRGEDLIRNAERADAIAKAIHYSWFAKPGEPWNRARMDAEWAALPDILRDSNRYAARHFALKLRWLGWDLAPREQAPAATDPSAGAYAFDAIPKRALETLGRMEHRRWSAEKLLAGYRPVGAVDAETYRVLKTLHHLHADFVPWERLDAPTKRNDWNVLIHAAAIAETAGLRIVARPRV